jgi:L-galactose dehydrogenase
MKYRKLGSTGLEVSVLGFGGSSLGSVFGDIDEQEGIRTVHVAVDNGINLIDTSPYYGETKAEMVLGRALHEIPREKYLLATKVGRYGVDDFDFSAARVGQSVDESLQRLNVDHIDFIQVHDIEFGTLDQIVNETIPALRELQAAGKVRFVGITGLPLKSFRRVMERTSVDQIQSYCHYCLNDTSLLDLLPYFKAKGVAIFNSAPLAMRLLSHEGPAAWHPAPAVLKAKCAAAAQYCKAHGGDLGKLALQFAVANKEIPAHIVGTAGPKRILQNIRDIEESLDEKLLGDVLKILKSVHNLTWPSGRTELATCET